MAVDTVIQIEDLLKPISKKSPTGVDLRIDATPTSLYYTLQGHRNSAREAERNELLSDDSGSEALQHWSKLKDAVVKALQKKTKDIELCVWLIEALVRTDGFEGLSAGFDLLNQYVNESWDGLFPEEDEDGVETKILSLIGLNGTTKDGTLIAPIKAISITQESSKGRFNCNKYIAARSADRIKDEKEKTERLVELGFSMESIFACVSAGEAAFYIDLDTQITKSLDAFSKLSNALDDRCKKDSPPTSNIRNCLKEVQSAVKFLAKDKLIIEEEQDESKSSEGSSESKASSGNITVSDRQAALNQLRQVSIFFKKAEPHSPISSSIDRVLKWANMPISSLIAELLPTEAAQQTYAQLTGVAIAKGSQSSSISGSPEPNVVAPADNQINENDGGW